MLVSLAIIASTLSISLARADDLLRRYATFENCNVWTDDRNIGSFATLVNSTPGPVNRRYKDIFIDCGNGLKKFSYLRILRYASSDPIRLVEPVTWSAEDTLSDIQKDGFVSVARQILKSLSFGGFRLQIFNCFEAGYQPGTCNKVLNLPTVEIRYFIPHGKSCRVDIKFFHSEAIVRVFGEWIDCTDFSKNDIIDLAMSTWVTLGQPKFKIED